MYMIKGLNVGGGLLGPQYKFLFELHTLCLNYRGAI
jgi:hypothetical protein